MRHRRYLVTLFLSIFRRFRTNWQLTLAAALIGFTTHGLLDAFTSYGTLLFWPFSDKRISWDIISIIDPLITIPLLLGVIWTCVFNDKRGACFALLFIYSIFLFNGYQHQRAINAINTEIKQQHLTATKVRAFPLLASSINWYGMAMSTRFLVFDVETPLLKPAKSKLVKRYPLLLPDALPAFVKQSPTLLRDFHVFNWFSDGYLILVNKDPLIAADGRFLIRHEPDTALWGIKFLPNQQHVSNLVSLNLGQ